MSSNSTVDILKGILIILVITGHVLLGSQMENPIRFFIYTFHMPVFMFIGGYLLNLSRLVVMSWSEIFRKYAQRMLYAWGIAWVVYTCLIHGIHHWSLESLVDSVINPYFHLWYVPSFFFMVCIIVFFRKHKIPLPWLFLPGLLAMWLQTQYSMSRICWLWPLIYVVEGVIYKESWTTYACKLGFPYGIGGAIALLLLNWFSGAFLREEPLSQYYMLIVAPLEIALCYWAGYFMDKDVFRSKTLRFIGKHSLAVYLWHVIPLFVIQRLMHFFFPESHAVYYICCGTVFIAFLIYSYRMSHS